jgi:RNA polymerase sigma-70 factor (ECF subfamily)
VATEFEQLIKDHGGRILAIARRYADIDAADDLYQEILVQLWRSIKSFRGDAKLETWIYRIGFNTAMTSVRKQIRFREGKAILHNQSRSEESLGGLCQAEILSEFMDSLADVDSSIMMMYLDGLNGQEMSSVLGMKLNTVQVRINRLKQMFSDRYLEGE